MHGLTGLIPRNLLNKSAFDCLIKKGQEYRKVTHSITSYWHYLNKIIQKQYFNLNRALIQIEQLDKTTSPQYYKLLKTLFERINNEHKIFSDKVTINCRQLMQFCNVIFLDLSNALLNFQQYIFNYKYQEESISERGKIYFKGLKKLQEDISFFQQSLSDVNLIYNFQEKQRRYYACKDTYSHLLDQHSTIDRLLPGLITLKDQILISYKSIQDELLKVIKVISTKNISQCKNFINLSCLKNAKISGFYTQTRQFSDVLELSTIFSLFSTRCNQQHLNCEINEKQISQIPAIIYYYHSWKDQYMGNCISTVFQLQKQVNQLVDQRKKDNKLFFQFIQNCIKNQQKIYLNDLKQCILFFDNQQKKIIQLFGNRFTLFIKSLNTTFQLSLLIYQKNLKKIYLKLQNSQNLVFEQQKLLDNFIKQLKQNIDKIIDRKQTKIIVKTQQNKQQILMRQKDRQKYKLYIYQKMENINKIFITYRKKNQTISNKLRISYNQIIQLFDHSQKQLMDLLGQCQSMHFSQQQFKKSFKKFQQDYQTIKNNQLQFFNTTNYGILINDKSIATFDGQIQTREKFLALKRPVQQYYQQIQGQRQGQQNNEIKTIQNKSTEKLVLSPRQSSPEATYLTINRQKKQLQFLLGRVTFKDDQQLLEYYTCGLYDKIILQGKIYITTQRLFFHSKFNTNNLFFGQTFIEIPKKDIIKIQKKKNAVFFDNSLLLTTINGALFFTSFFSRDLAFDKICQVFNIKQTQQVIEEEQEEPVVEGAIQQQELPRQDDIDEKQIKQRKSKIDDMIRKVQYRTVQNVDFQGINAYTILKYFFSARQYTINRKTFPNFQSYLKTLLDHSDINAPLWSPSLQQYLNPINIRKQTPHKFKRLVKSEIPLGASGIPFMPKRARSQQQETLYIYSKDKWILESTCLTFGAPYGDCFQVNLQLICQQKSQNKCGFHTQIYFNFYKSILVRSIIQAQGFDSLVMFSAKRVEEMKKYINIKIKQKNKNKINDQKRQLQQLQEQFDKERQQFKQTIQKMKINSNQLTSQSKKYKTILLGSLILNLILFILWIS